MQPKAKVRLRTVLNALTAIAITLTSVFVWDLGSQPASGENSEKVSTILLPSVSKGKPQDKDKKNPTPTPTPTPDPSETPGNQPRIYWGAYNPGVPFDMSKLSAFESVAGKAVSIVHWGQPWMMGGRYQPFQTAEFEKVRAHGSIPMLNWGSWHLGQGVTQPDFQLQDIYQGNHDAYLRQWAEAAKAWGRPFFLRFNHEMNGWWFPWSEQVNGNQAGDYIKAWIHVHNLFEHVGATNVTWVWCINEIGPKTTLAQLLYPGDNYVDWVAIDGYNRQTSSSSSWRTFSEVMNPSYDQLVSLAPHKPIMIAEFASAEYIGTSDDPLYSKAEWIRDALEVQVPNNFPRIKAIVWFNWNDNNPDKTWPIDSSPEAVQAFAKAIALDYYAPNDFGGVTTSPVAPLTP